jgi:hypothetical protein
MADALGAVPHLLEAAIPLPWWLSAAEYGGMEL